MAATATALVLPSLLPQHHPTPTPRPPTPISFKPFHLLSTVHHRISSSAPPLATIAAVTLPILLNSPDALAVDGEFGILEGRAFTLVHPIVMGGLFLNTLWAGYLGWQWRRVRTIQAEINLLKKDPPPEDQPTPPVINTRVELLAEERKALLKGNYRDRHFNAGSILLGFGVLEAVGGCLDTWICTGQLFPGPHLFTGAAITVLWASAAALVPAMQKGNDTARNLHIALNVLNVVLFLSQIRTGVEIVYKVFESSS